MTTAGDVADQLPAAAVPTHVDINPRVRGGLLTGLLVTVLLLVLGELAPGLFPVRVRIAVTAQDVRVEMDGQVHQFHVPSGRAYMGMRFVEPGPVDREFQIDGSDVVVRDDRDPAQIRAIEDTPLYRLDAWLRDEYSYSRWEDIALLDAGTGQQLAQGREAVQTATLPANFVLEAALRRPEAPAQLWLQTGGPAPALNSVLEFDRTQHLVRWLVGSDGKDEIARWFFPEQPLPFAANLLELIGRAAAAAYTLALVVLGLGWALHRIRGPWHNNPGLPTRWTRSLLVAGCGVWLGAAIWITIELYHQLPHLLDASTYAFQARLMQAGRLWLDAPPFGDQFITGSQVIADGRWIGQYPPGAPALLAVGGLFGLSWLVGPICSLLAIAGIAAAGRWFYSDGVGAVTLGLGLMSPFVLFLAGSYMSEPIDGALLALALAAFAYADKRHAHGWYAAAGVLLGMSFLTREFNAVLFGLPLGTWLLLHRRWRALAVMVTAATPWLAIYLVYNAAVTGNPLLLPRNVVNPSDQFGFGVFADHEHTLAAGLSYTEMNLTLLQFDLFGWPPLFALGLPLLPFLLRTASRKDALMAGGVLCCIAGYVLVPGHGAALGPRYYYGALPYLLPLCARGFGSVWAVARRMGWSDIAVRTSVAVVVTLLTLNSVAFYLPQTVERRTNYLAMVGRPGLALPFVQTTLQGPRLVGFNGPSLVLVTDSELFKTLSALNCPLLDPERIQECPVLFVGAGKDLAPQLITAFPGRAVFVASPGDRTVTLTPYAT